MKFLNVLFVNIYGLTQRSDNINKGKIDGVLWTSICISFCVTVWYSLLITLFYYLMFRSNPPAFLITKSVITLVIVLFTGITNLYYNKNDRAFKLYRKYLDLNNSLWSMRKIFLILMTMYIVPFTFIFLIDYVALK